MNWTSLVHKVACSGVEAGDRAPWLLGAVLSRCQFWLVCVRAEMDWVPASFDLHMSWGMRQN